MLLLLIILRCFRLIGYKFFIVGRVQRPVDANMEVASSDDFVLVLVSDGFGQGLEARIYFFLCGKEVRPQSSLASLEDRSQCEEWE